MWCHIPLFLSLSKHIDGERFWITIIIIQGCSTGEKTKDLKKGRTWNLSKKQVQQRSSSHLFLLTVSYTIVLQLGFVGLCTWCFWFFFSIYQCLFLFSPQQRTASTPAAEQTDLEIKSDRMGRKRWRESWLVSKGSLKKKIGSSTLASCVHVQWKVIQYAADIDINLFMLRNALVQHTHTHTHMRTDSDADISTQNAVFYFL